jgi:hypothetical protein
MNKLCWAAVLLTSSFVLAQDSTKSPWFQTSDHKRYIGAGAGFISGNGISYRTWPGKNWGIQVTGFPFYWERYYDQKSSETYDETRDSGFSKIGFLSAGAMGLRTVARARDIRVFGYGGGNIYATYENQNYHYVETQWNEPTGQYDSLTGYVRANTKEYRLTAGAGIGGDLQMWRLVGSLMVGVQGYYEMESQSKGLIPSVEVAGYFGF